MGFVLICCECLWRCRGAAAGLLSPHNVQLHRWLYTCMESSIPAGPKVFICIDYRWNLFFSLLFLHCFWDCIHTHLIRTPTSSAACWMLYASQKNSGCCPHKFWGSSNCFCSTAYTLIKKQFSVHFLVWSSMYSFLPLRQAQGQNAFKIDCSTEKPGEQRAGH